MKKEMYMQPLSEVMELLHEQLICASNLNTDSSDGLEGFTVDSPGSWS